MLRYLTAGESHGRALLTVVEGMPAGLPLRREDIDRELARRQLGYGRGGRMKIERDRVQVISGVRGGVTLGSPVGLMIDNLDWTNWQEQMSPDHAAGPPVTRPRPGHADLAGACKYGHRDIRNVLERASARETAARVAAGGAACALLRRLGVWVVGYVVALGGVEVDESRFDLPAGGPDLYREWRRRERESPLRCPDRRAEEEMMSRIDRARAEGDTLGGVVEVRVFGVPPGLGSYSQWDRRLDGDLARAVMSVQGIKGVEIGLGFAAASMPGSRVHDPILPGEGRWPRRVSNGAGGLEGGVSNGEAVVVRAAMKPIATLGDPLPSVDIMTGEALRAHHERSDVCAVPAAGVVVEAAVALEIARALLEKFGGDSVTEIERNLSGYLEGLS
jgi:chorismate synthase